MLKLDNVTISYKNVPTVQNFNLDMKEGQIVSLVGESGSGKTTVIRAVLGLLAGGGKVTEGSITFEGEDLLSYTPEQWRKLRGSDISMIFQDSGAMMNPTRKVGKVFTEYILTHEKISKKEAWSKGIAMLERMRLPSPDNIMESYPFQLSGGMRQRVVIAIALACDPKVLIADEPTTALDVTIQAQILDLMRDLQKKIKTSIIIITHNLGVVANIADRVAVMYGGKLVETGDVEDIFHNPCHEYTKGLLRSIPKAHEKGGELQAIPGTPPDLMEPPVGCPFAARCKETMIVCQKYMPDYTDCGKNHKSACWMLDEMAQEVNSDEK